MEESKDCSVRNVSDPVIWEMDHRGGGGGGGGGVSFLAGVGFWENKGIWGAKVRV